MHVRERIGGMGIVARKGNDRKGRIVARGKKIGGQGNGVQSGGTAWFERVVR